MKELSVKERLILFIKEKGLSQGKFEKTVGLSNGFVNNISKGIGAEKLQKILCVFPDLNQTWLLTGEGDMLNTKESHLINNKEKPSLHTIKYFPNVDGTMGDVQFLDNPTETTLDIIIPGYSDCKFAINAYGDSMSPLINSGQIVLLSEWLESFVDWGKIYLVITKSGYRVIKRLFPSPTENKIVCRSENQQASPDFEIAVGDILHIFLVKGWVCRDVI